MHLYTASSNVISHMLLQTQFISTLCRISEPKTNLVLEKGSVNHNKLFCEILVHAKSGSVLSSYQTVGINIRLTT